MEKQGQGASSQEEVVSGYCLVVPQCCMVIMVEKEGWHLQMMLFSMDMNIFMMFVNNVLLCGPAGLELVVVALFRNRFKLCLSAFYRPPSSPPSIFDTLCNSLLSVHRTYFSKFVILGDFNVNFEVSHRFYTYLSDFMASFSLSQVVQSPTHFSPCGRWSLIDLAFVSNLSCLSTCTVIPQLANSDHLGLCITMKYQREPSLPTCRRQVWQYKHADFEKAKNLLLDIDIDKLLVTSDIQLSWTCFKHTFLDIMERCIPRTVLPNRRNLPWLNKKIIQLIRRRNCYFRKAHCNGSAEDLEKFKQLRNRIVTELWRAKQTFFHSVTSQKPKGILEGSEIPKLEN